MRPLTLKTEAKKTENEFKTQRYNEELVTWKDLEKLGVPHLRRILFLLGGEVLKQRMLISINIEFKLI